MLQKATPTETRELFSVIIHGMNSARVNIIAAIGKNRELGKDDRLLWHIPEDLRHFKKLTLGHPVIMGRKTFESILTMLHTPLPGRINIVATRNQSWSYKGVIVAHSIEEGVEKARALDAEEIFIAGGAEIYAAALPLSQRLYLTRIDAAAEHADAFFPPYEHLFSHVVSKETAVCNGLHVEWLTLERAH